MRLLGIGNKTASLTQAAAPNKSFQVLPFDPFSRAANYISFDFRTFLAQDKAPKPPTCFSTVSIPQNVSQANLFCDLSVHRASTCPSGKRYMSHCGKRENKRQHWERKNHDDCLPCSRLQFLYHSLSHFIGTFWSCIFFYAIQGKDLRFLPSWIYKVRKRCLDRRLRKRFVFGWPIMLLSPHNSVKFKN